ncbi:MAG: dihydroorotase [Rhodobiaceae bacterium]|nr:dihydroorotase [Rhodobiaceae bacterium]MCC0056993.1 dihydroorotase [Rhodobiaceae bacterium]
MTDAGKMLLIDGAHIVDPSQALDGAGRILVVNGKIAGCGKIGDGDLPADVERLDARGLIAAPGLVDMRVFVGEPGYEHRETLASASHAAAAGGVTSFVCMPDTNPVIDDVALVDFIQRAARDTAQVNVYPSAALTKGLEGREMTEIGLLSEAGAVGFTDGRHAVRNPRIFLRALTYARDFDALVMHHPEEPELVGSGVMHQGEMATRLGLTGIPVTAETIMIDRDMRLVAQSKGRYHASQLSSAEGAEALARGRRAGLNVTAGVSINHLTLNENDIGAYRTFFKMAPPLRTEDDRQALIEALRTGVIDAIVSSHDPQDVETKRHPFAEAADGAVGLETLLPAALRLYHAGDLSLVQLIRALSTRPAEILGIGAGTLKKGANADMVLFDLDAPWVVRKEDLRSRSKNSPFDEARLSGRVVRTLVAGETVYAYAPA